GTIKGGTLTTTGGATFTTSNLTLDGVTLGADLTVQNGGMLNVRNGLTLSNKAKLIYNSTGSTTDIYFLGTQTLGGTGEVVFGGTSSNNYLYAGGDGSQAGAAVLTIGSGILVHGSQDGTITSYYE